MIRTYGKVRHDAIIILDVAGADERAVLQVTDNICCMLTISLSYIISDDTLPAD